MATEKATPAQSGVEPGGRGLTRLASSPIFRYLVLSAQLALVLRLIWSFSLEGRVFGKLAVLVWAGFTVHYFLPDRARLPFFGLLSAGGLLVIFGVIPGLWVLGLGLAVLGICHLPIPFAARLAIIVAAGALLGIMRAGLLPSPWTGAIWPIFGSMFALRLIVYLYDLKHQSAPFSFWRSVGYFFMLPNICFPLFPVVDYQTFCRTYDSDKDRTRVYQSGIDWMVRGAVHLILYRLIYQHLPIDTTSVVDVPQLLRYLLWPFLLYLNVSGLFHLVVGMLHLFSFNLPETHHLFYLASSFTDFWRRINIYWKDFMMKVFYYPSFFRLRRLGNGAALVLGTFVVFLATWVLHSWQWFWLRGSFLLKGSDALFWTILAVLVAANVLYESRRPMKRRLGSAAVPLRESVRKAVQGLGVFTAICVLWSLWVSDSPRDWLSLFSVVGKAGPRDLWLVPAVLGFGVVFVLLGVWFERRRARPSVWTRQAAGNVAAVVAIMLLGSSRVYSHFDERIADVLTRLKSPGLNSRDAARRQRDYYEKLNDVGWENPELAKVYLMRPADWGSIRYRPDLARFSEGLPYLELLPNAHGRHRGAEVRFNRWGMRDRDYPVLPEPGSYRIALVGASHTFASGVPQEQGFEARVEDRLNREGNLGRFERAEILNFSTEGYTALDVLAVLDRKVLSFQPHALLYVVHQLDAQSGVRRLARVPKQKGALPYPELLEFARAEGVRPGSPENAAIRALDPKQGELLRWTYRQIVERCRSRGIVPVAAYLPILTPQPGDLPVARLIGIAREAGFQTIDLSGVYGGYDRDKLQIAVWDDHPNATGHRLVAERLYAALRGAEDSLWRAHDEGRDQRAGASVHSQGVPTGRKP